MQNSIIASKLRGGGGCLRQDATLDRLSKAFSKINASLDFHRKYAFTLSEVLITLGIIGVVAAMTLPSLMVKKRNMELESCFKTAYSLLSQAVLRMSADNSNIAETYCVPRDQTSTKFVEDFSKYFQTTQIYFNQRTLYLNKLGYKQEKFFQANGKDLFNKDIHDNGIFFIKNGMMIASSGCWWWSAAANPLPMVDFMIDTNGVKGPNRFGYDLFYFQINNKNILLPSTQKYTFAVISSQLEQCCNFTKSSTCSINTDNGAACSHFALKNEYPQDTNKKYWENLH